jgi:hypothetical protein
MSKHEQIKIMISSRCEPLFSGKTLAEIRENLQQSLEKEEFLGKKIFKVWINEPEPAESAKQTWWDVCIEKVDDCDILLVLYNGQSGSKMSEEGLGICHAEYRQGVTNSPGKVYLIE